MTREIRPVVANPRQRRTLEQCRFEVDTVAGAVTWWGDRAARATPQPPVRLALPGRGEPALTAVVRATYPPSERNGFTSQPLLSRLWLVDAAGRVVARSAPYPPGLVEQIWPREGFESLEAAGVRVEDRAYSSPRDALREFPGATPSWLTGSNRVIGVTVAVLVAAVLIALVLTH